VDQLARWRQTGPAAFCAARALPRSDQVVAAVAVDRADRPEVAVLRANHRSVLWLVNGFALHRDALGSLAGPLLIGAASSRFGPSKHVSHVARHGALGAESIVGHAEHAPVRRLSQRLAAVDLAEGREVVPRTVATALDFSRTNWSVSEVAFVRTNRSESRAKAAADCSVSNVAQIAAFYQLGCRRNFRPAAGTLAKNLSGSNELPSRIGEERANSSVILRLNGARARGGSVRLELDRRTRNFDAFRDTTGPVAARFTNSDARASQLETGIALVRAN